ncbi:unnamed protein product [Brassicogethes aeneus]|uniref:DNA ligase n=1 Tax=Brassicogethes aeneus TaxID=1431903 RepID=A0A9P0BB77_BRAAE|nr:unnamed protein product [Brassicogethes aeneus]
MSENEEEKPFAAEVAKQGRAVCKKCKQKCLQGELRLAKLVANPFGDGKMKSWHHLDCLFQVFSKQRATTRKIDDTSDIDGWDLLSDENQGLILDKLKEFNKDFKVKAKSPKKQGSPSRSPRKRSKSPVKESKLNLSANLGVSKDLLFKGFRILVADVTNVSSYTDKSNIMHKMFTEGLDGKGFKGDTLLWVRLLLPGVVKRVYNLQSKQLIKLFAKIFHTDQESMLEHLEQGDIGETIQDFFKDSKQIRPAKKSLLAIQEVDDFLENLTKLTKEEEQISHFKKFLPKCTGNDLKIVIRLIVHDLRMNAGAKHVLDAIHPDAYKAYQSSRDLGIVLKRCLEETKSTSVKATINVMTPVLPMLAQACKSVEQAMKACPNGMYSEIKYDGERVQVHKKGSEFKYFSRNLKPVLNHKVGHFKDYIPKAFPLGNDLILDSEILMIDTVTGNPLPFGTLGVHKKNEFKDASVCLFVFDCIYYNGESLTDKSIELRKKILKENMAEIPNHIVFSEMKEIHKPDDLRVMIAKVLSAGLEGLVLKDLKGIYEPGKRHWLKVKKDYLFDGAMADSADLIVLGAWYGTGKKGGMMSVFLMGSYNKTTKRFCTVTKVHTGHDDKTLERLQSELDMVKISCDASKVPSWLNCTKTMIPDFVAKDPKNQPVWEITGAEFTQHDVHTADGISIRFPRVTKIRDDKDWGSATTVQELKVLYTTSKEHTDVSLLMNQVKKEDETSPKPPKQKDLLSYIKKESKGDVGEEPSPKKKKKTIIEVMEDDEKRKNRKRKSPSKEPNPKPKKAKPEESPVKKHFEKQIPSYFKGVKAVLGPKIKESYSELIRYFIAYGGVVLNETELDQATHVIHVFGQVDKPNIKSPKTARHVHIDWIKNTVANEVLPEDIRPYMVRWDPSG